MRKTSYLVYGLICYAIFFAIFLYMIGFIGGFGVPTTLDAPGSATPGKALLINTLLLGLFAVQHSVMARPGFKRVWTRVVPKPVERSTYVLASSLCLILLAWAWQPMGGVIWQVDDPVGRSLIFGAYAFGWLLLLVSTFMLNHFDLFGLRQVWLYFRGRAYTPLEFKLPVLYRYVRHPLYVGWLFIFWAAPTMTVAHLIFAIATTVYILIAIQLEERDLLEEHPDYAAYRREVPMLVPFTKKPRQIGERHA